MASVIAAGTTAGTALAMAGDTSGALQLQTNGTTTAVTIDTSQNVGIGTSSPGAKLDVSSSGANIIASRSTGSYAAFQRFAPTGQQAYDFYTINGVEVARISADPSYFAFSNGSGATERMRIDSSGNVLIGETTNAGYRLHVTNVGSTVARITRTTNTGGLIDFNYNATPVGSISTNGTTTTYATSSDYRLKEDVTPMIGALATIAKLKPCNYKWIADGSDGQGFIAHEIQAVVPDCVVGEKDAVDDEGKPRYQGVDTSFLVATLTAAIQEQQALIIQLQADVAALKGIK